MKKIITILSLSLLIFNPVFADKYPKLKEPVKSISGSIKKLKVPGKIDLKDYTVKNPGYKIYIDFAKRRAELKGNKNNYRLCKPFKNIELFPSMPEIGGHKWKQEGASPIDFINFAEPMIENMQ
jgi:hypothetical protein